MAYGTAATAAPGGEAATRRPVARTLRVSGEQNVLSCYDNPWPMGLSSPTVGPIVESPAPARPHPMLRTVFIALAETVRMSASMMD